MWKDNQHHHWRTVQHRQHVVWLHGRTRDNRCHLHSQATAREAHECRQKSVLCLHGPGKGFRPSTKAGHRWAMRKLGIQKWLIRWVQSLYRGARRSMRIGDTYSEEFQVQVGVHQGSVLSPLLFIMVLEALSKEFRTGCPWELFYAGHLVIMSKTLNELLEKLKTWKKRMEAKGLKANMTKTKLMISGPELNLLRDSGKYPCAFCRKWVGRNAIYCTGCAHWVHKRCSGIKGTLANMTDFQCRRCKGIARPIDGRPTTSIVVEESELEVVYEFCYLGEMIDAGGGCERVSIARKKGLGGSLNSCYPYWPAEPCH